MRLSCGAWLAGGPPFGWMLANLLRERSSPSWGKCRPRKNKERLAARSAWARNRQVAGGARAKSAEK